MNVVEVLQFGHIAGGERVALALAAYLRSMGDSVSFVVPREGDVTAALDAAGFDYDLLALDGLLDFRAARALAPILDRRGADICHVHGCEAVETLGPLGSSGSRARVVVHGHIANTFSGPGLRSWVQRGINRRGRRRTDAVICVSRATREAYAAQGYEAPQLHVVHNGLPAPPADEPVADWARALRSAPGALRILEAARLTSYKGQAQLLEAAAALVSRGRPVQIVFLGEAAEPGVAEGLRRHAESLGLADHVHWGGFVPEVGAWIRAADVCALPSLREGLPMFLIEAMWRGKPVVASDVDGVPEAVTHEQTGLLVPPQDVPALTAALERCFDAPSRAAWGAAGRERAAAAFSLDAMGQGVRAVFERVLAP